MAFAWRLWRTAGNGLRTLVRREPGRALTALSVIAVVFVIIGMSVWSALALFDHAAYAPLKPRLVSALLAVMFLVLAVLVVVSATVLVWNALFRTRAAAFHLALPVSERAVFWQAASEGGLWAGWAVLVLLVPLVAASTRDAVQPALFAGAATLAVLAFLACCLAAGTLAALLLARLVPLLRRALTGSLILGAIGLALGISVLVARIDERGSGFFHDALGALAFAEHPLLPSGWMQQAFTAALAAHWSVWAWHLGLLASTAAGIALIAEAIAVWKLRVLYDAITGRGRQRARARSRALWSLPGLPADVGLLAAKDLRLFLRDPAQLVQFSAFVALLAFYLLMLPRLGQAFAFDAHWRLIVGGLNLLAVGMALATFTGRFVYPLLSLEGRRLWVLATAPWPRSRVVTAKFLFAQAVAVPVGVLLVALSGLMLHLPAWTIAYQAGVIACLGCGLTAAALGLGARFADYAEDNPGKLVAGYGGTVNLLASLIFAAVVLSGAVLPMLLPTWWTFAGSGSAVVLITVLWTWRFLSLAWREFDHAGDVGSPRLRRSAG